MLKNFYETYNTLQKDNLDTLGLIYDENIRFIDPAHEIHGLPHLIDYFAGLYSSLDHISFDFTQQLCMNNDCTVQWVMTFSHPKLARGRDIEVAGISALHLLQNGKVDMHRDYFDLGAMLYEHLPILGGLVRNIKRRLIA